MKLPLLAMTVFLISPTTVTNCFRRQRRTLSANAKKPASLAGFLSLQLNLSRPLVSLSSPGLSFTPRSSSPHSLLKLQVASYPA
jgi:hypothetical protein